MLDAIRKRSGSIVVKVLLVFLVLSFGAWGIGDYIGGGATNQAVATVGGREISPQAFSNEYQREMNRLRQLFGGNLDAEMARTLGIQRTVLNRMIRTEVIAAAAQDYGLMVTDEMVLREIQSMDAFRGLSGNFDKGTFRQAINNAGFTEEMFIALMRGDLSRGYLLESFDSGAAVTDTMLKAIYGYREEIRAAEIVLIPDDAFSIIAEPTAGELSAYHQENSARFMAPEYRALTYIDLRAADLAQEITVSDEEVSQAYEAREAEFVTPARRNLDQAIFASADAANAALDLIATGRGFADVAAELTGTSAEALNLGWVGRDDLISQALSDAAFSLGAGEISAAIESPLGWHVLSVVEAEDETRQALSDVRDRIRDDVALEKAVDSLFSLANALEDEMGGGATLEDASKALSLPLVRIDGIDARGMDRTGTAVDTLPAGNFLGVAFATPEGSESPLTESTSNSYFTVRVDSIVDPVLRPLDEVSDTVREMILADRRQASAEVTATGIVAAINGGMPLLDALAQASLGADTVIVNAPSFKRNGTGAPQEMPRALITALFDQSIGQGGYARATGGVTGFVVGRVSAVTPADFAADTTGVEKLNAEMVGGIRSDLMDQLATALQETYSVSVNENALNQNF